MLILIMYFFNLPDFSSFEYLFQNSNFILKDTKIVILTLQRNSNIYLSIELSFYELNMPNKHDSNCPVDVATSLDISSDRRVNRCSPASPVRGVNVSCLSTVSMSNLVLVLVVVVLEYKTATSGVSNLLHSCVVFSQDRRFSDWREHLLSSEFCSHLIF